MISPNISMVPLRLPMTGGPRGTTNQISAGLALPASLSEPQISNSMTIPAAMKMTNFSIAAIMEDEKPSNEIIKINQLEESLGKEFKNLKKRFLENIISIVNIGRFVKESNF
jgi:hypothetical protein